jgi:3D (Asp-Asp-Asp) domain-containing protein
MVDHINDQRFYTYAPITLEVKPDYFTSGVKLFASFEDSNSNESEASLDVTVPDIRMEAVEQSTATGPRHRVTVRLDHEIGGMPISKTFSLDEGGRITIGRTKESDLSLDDPSVSKMHAALVLDNEGVLILSDTGSTNGTFVDGERIAYGKAVKLSPGKDLRFGTVDVSVRVIERSDLAIAAAANGAEDDKNAGETQRIGEFQFKTKHSGLEDGAPPAPTQPSIPVPSSQLINGKTETLLPEQTIDVPGPERSKET